MRPIILFAGMADAGKSTAGDHLVEHHGFARVKFATWLKAMTAAVGLTQEHIEGGLKRLPCDLICGKSPTDFMQKLGTDFGRDMIGDDLWTGLWKTAVRALPPGQPVVADDCRFGNEVAAARSMSPFTLVVRVKRKVPVAAGAHVSELQAFPVDLEIHNDSTVEALLAAVDDLVLRDRRLSAHS